MPTLLRIGPYRFFFYSREPDEPAHVHVRRDQMECKIWLETVAVADAGRFSAHELGVISRHVREHRAKLLNDWHVHFPR